MTALFILLVLMGVVLIIIGALVQYPIALPPSIKMTLLERAVGEFENNPISYTCFAFGVLFFVASVIVLRKMRREMRQQ